MTYTLEEQKKHRQKWIEALRSGKYDQTHTRLRDSDGHCCLGVACELYPHGDFDYGDVFTTYTLEDGKIIQEEELQMPDAVMDYFGLCDNEGSFRYVRDIPYFEKSANTLHETTLPSLAAMNDDGAPFNVIANLIENEPEGLVRTSCIQ